MIELNNITKTYNPKKANEFTALKNVSLTVKDGEMTAVIGKSGAGKSTLLHILPVSTNVSILDYPLDMYHY